MSVNFEAFEERPPRIAVVLTFVPAFVAVTATVPAPLAVALAAVGSAAALVGVHLGRRAYVTVGTVVLFAAVLFGGIQGLPVLQVTVGAAATVVAWDAGTNAIGISRQIGARSPTNRVLVVHTLATSTVAVAVGTGVFVVYWLSRGGEPTVAIALLLFASVLFAWLLDR